MDRQIRTVLRKEAMFAIAFASGLLCIPIPASSKNTHKYSKTLMSSMDERITPSTSVEFQSYNLLCIADDYLYGNSKERVEEIISNRNSEFEWRSFIRHPEWKLSLLLRSVTSSFPYSSRPKKSVSKENLALANLAIEDALKRIKASKNEFIKLNVIYLASLLFQQAQNAEGLQRCNRLLDDSIADCESSANPSDEMFGAATSILYLKADSILDVHIMDVNPETIPHEITVHKRTKTKIDKHSESDFQNSEALMLRAVALADKLDKTSHLRRKAHRDMSLWYSQLGKTEKAEQQKQELFELLGFKDDSILYPQNGGCGHLVWWRREKVGAMGCGMG